MNSWEDAVRSLIEDPLQQVLVRACYFDPPLLAAAKRFAQGPEWEAMRCWTGKPRGVALDVGAGNGIVSYALARDGWKTIAVEPDPSDLVGAGAIRSLAQEAGLEIRVLEAVGERLPIDDGSVSLVIARQVLHHASHLRGFCKELARVLEPGGQLILTRDHVISGPSQLQVFLDKHPLHSRYGGENAFQLSDYQIALKEAGLKIESKIGSLQSVINYAPYTVATLRNELANRLGPLRKAAEFALRPAPVMNAALWGLSALDRRPGRLVSFVCRKD